MQLDAIRGHSFLAFEVIEEADAGNLYRHIRVLKTGSRREDCVELRTRVGDARGQRTARTDASRIGNLSDHCVARVIGQDHVIIGIVSAHIFFQRGVQNPNRSFGWLHATIVRNGIRRCDGQQTGDRRAGFRAEVQ